MDELNSEFAQLSLSNLKEEMQTILSEQSKLKEEMQKNLNNQSKLKEEMQKNLRHQSKMNERIKSIFKHLRHNTFFNDNYFPLDNDDDLKYMENKLSKKNGTDPEFRSHLVDDLIFIGGRDVKDMVIRLMTKLFTMKLLSGYSRSGGSRSHKLSGLNIYNVIFDAITSKFPNTPETEKDFKEAIDNHLKKAPRPSV